MKKRTVFADNMLLWGGLLALAISPTQYSFSLMGKINVCPVDPLVWALGILLAGIIIAKREWFFITKLPLFACVFLVFCGISLVLNKTRLDGLKDLIQYTEYFLIAPAVFLYLFFIPQGRQRLLLVFGAISSVVITFGLIQYLRLEAIDVFNISSSFGNVNVLGGFLSLALPLVLSVALSAKQMLWLRIWSSFIFLGGLLLLLSGGAFVAVLTAAVVLVCLQRTKTAWLSLIAATALLLFVFPLLPRENLWTAHDSIAVFTPGGEPAMRYPEWQAAMSMTADRPLAGVGLGGYQTHVGQYAGAIPNQNRKAEPDSQNMYLVLASTIGIPGALCFVLLLGTGIMCGVRRFMSDRASDTSSYQLGASMALLAFAVNCIWSPLLVRGIGIPLAFVLAMAYLSHGRRVVSGAGADIIAGDRGSGDPDAGHLVCFD